MLIDKFILRRRRGPRTTTQHAIWFGPPAIATDVHDVGNFAMFVGVNYSIVVVCFNFGRTLVGSSKPDLYILCNNSMIWELINSKNLVIIFLVQEMAYVLK